MYMTRPQKRVDLRVHGEEPLGGGWDYLLELPDGGTRRLPIFETITTLTGTQAVRIYASGVIDALRQAGQADLWQPPSQQELEHQFPNRAFRVVRRRGDQALAIYRHDLVWHLLMGGWAHFERHFFDKMYAKGRRIPHPCDHAPYAEGS